MRTRLIPRAIGFLAFAAGLLIAIVAGIAAPDNSVITLTLLILGIVVGVLNISTKDVVTLLIAATALIVVGTIGFAPLDGLINGLGTNMNQIVFNLARLMAPAAIIGAVRAFITIGFPKY